MVALVMARQPYLLFNVKCDEAYVCRVRYISTNHATNAAGTAEVSTIAAKTEIPNLPKEYHRLVRLLAGKILSEELASLTNKDQTPRFSGMQQAAEFYNVEYEKQLAKDLASARRKSIDKMPRAFEFCGAELQAAYGR